MHAARGKGERPLPAGTRDASSVVAPGATGTSAASAGERAQKVSGKDAGDSPLEAGAPLFLSALRALAQIGSSRTELFASLATTAKDTQLRTEAVLALASSKAPDAGERLFKLWPDISPGQHRTARERLASTKPGAKSIVAAVGAGTLKKAELDGPTVERLQAVPGDDPALTTVLGDLASLFRPVLALDGSENAWTETEFSFDGPLTVETWVRLAPGLTNADGIVGVPGKLDVNFHAGKLRVWAGSQLHDVIVATKAMTPGLWTHVAAVRDADDRWQLYLDGQRDPAGCKAPTRGRLENGRIAWTGAKGGTHGAFAEYRQWSRARTAEEIARDFDRGLAGAPAARGGATFLSPSAAERQPAGHHARIPKRRPAPLRCVLAENLPHPSIRSQRYGCRAIVASSCVAAGVSVARWRSTAAWISAITPGCCAATLRDSPGSACTS